jgi:hypothetical protein
MSTVRTSPGVITAIRRHARLLGLAVIALAIGLAIWGTPALAQTTGWSTPQLIFEGRGVIYSPALVADGFGQVHGFWIFQPDQTEIDNQTELIYYTRLDQPTWPVNDIFAVPKSFGTLQAVMSADGLNLLWAGRFFAWSGPPPRIGAARWMSWRDTPKLAWPMRPAVHCGWRMAVAQM